MVLNLQKSCKYIREVPQYHTQFSLLLTCYITMVHLSQLITKIVIWLFIKVHTCCRFPQILCNVPFLFQDPLQDATFHLQSSCLLRLFLTVTISQTLLSKTLMVLKSIAQIFCRTSLSWDSFDVFLIIIQRLWILRKRHSDKSISLITVYLSVISTNNMLYHC